MSTVPRKSVMVARAFGAQVSRRVAEEDRGTEQDQPAVSSLPPGFFPLYREKGFRAAGSVPRVSEDSTDVRIVQ